MVKNMTHSQESRVSSSQDCLRLPEESISSVSALVNKLNSCSNVGMDVFDDDKLGKMTTNTQDGKRVDSIFPWRRSFCDTCRTSVGSKSIKLLENLLTVYLQHVSIDVKNCYLRPNRASKLKKCMNETLLFFHMFYQDVREPMEHSFYLNKMTDLMAMYIDMEIKASSRRKETTKKVVSRLTSSLYIFLADLVRPELGLHMNTHLLCSLLFVQAIAQVSRNELYFYHSEIHMLDAILKAKLITSVNQELCIPILGKLMNNLRMSPLYDLLYVRCVLVFKLWKKIVKNAEEKKRITRLALQRLSVPTNFLDKSKLFNDVLPRIPKSKKNITMFFMQAKFNLKTACEAFLKMCKDLQSLGDKPLFFGEHHGESSPSVGDKTVDVGGRNNSLFNNIWSSISVVTDSNLTEYSQLKTLSGDKDKGDMLTGKRPKSQEKRGKKKNKAKTHNSAAGKIEDRNKKKKKVKKKLVSGNAISVLDDVTSSNGNSQVSSKGDVKKKKKKLHSVEDNVSAQVQEEELVVVKTEKNIQDLEERGLNQIDNINNMSYVDGISTSQVKDNLEQNVSLPTTIVLPDAVEPVNEVNSSSEKFGVHGLVETDDNRIAVRVDHSVRCDSENVQVTSEIFKVQEQVSSNQKSHVRTVSKEIVPVAVANINRIIGESVIVPISNSTLLKDDLANTSHKSLPTTVVENEAVVTVTSSGDQDTSSTDMMASRNIQSYLLLPQTCDVPTREVMTYVCDSSIKLEVPIQEEGYVVVDDDVPIPKDDCEGVDNDYFTRFCTEYDSDVEILTDLRQQESRQRTIPEEGEEVLMRNERDLHPRDSVPNNLFATENSNLLYEALGGVLPESSIEFDNRGGVLESPFMFGGDEVTELESPAIETIDENEKRSLTSMINNIRCAKDKGAFAQFGTERQDWLECNGRKVIYRDSMLGLQHPTCVRNTINVNDDVSTDEDSCYEYNSSSASSSPQQTLGGGKVGSHSFGVSVIEKDSSPCSNVSDSPPTSNNTYLKLRDSYTRINSGTSTIIDRNTPDRPRTDQKSSASRLARSSVCSLPITTAMNTSTVTATPVSTLKNFNVNLMKCMDGKPINDQKKLNRTSRYLSTTEDVRNRDLMESNVAVSSYTIPDVVRDAHNATEKSDKIAATQMVPQKTPSQGLSSGNGNNVGDQPVRKRGRPPGTKQQATLKPVLSQHVTRQGRASNSAIRKRLSKESDNSEKILDTPPKKRKMNAVSEEKRRKSNIQLKKRKTNTVSDKERQQLDNQPKKRKINTVSDNKRPHTRICSRLGIEPEVVEELPPTKKRRL